MSCRWSSMTENQELTVIKYTHQLWVEKSLKEVICIQMFSMLCSQTVVMIKIMRTLPSTVSKLSGEMKTMQCLKQSEFYFMYSLFFWLVFNLLFNGHLVHLKKLGCASMKYYTLKIWSDWYKLWQKLRPHLC